MGTVAAACLTFMAGGVTQSPADDTPPPPTISVQNGRTQPVFGYADAIRQRVWVDTDFDSDGDGVNDRIAVDIKRPAASDEGLKVPVIMDLSPYYSTLGRGNESQLKIDDANGDGLLAQWPLFLDNYFVPRGYAVALVDMTGTNHSTGCPTVQGPTDNAAGREVIDWLEGRRTARDAQGNPVTAASWFNGRTGMIGKSYDSALAASTAVSGVPGLTTVVTESGPYDYYDYTRYDGVIQRGNHYVSSLANTVTDPGRRAYCAAVRANLDANDADATGNFTSPFWTDRSYIPFVPQVKASVLATHGIQDTNVRFDHFSQWWYALGANHVPRKAFLMQTGHVDPFDNNRAWWVDELSGWFDYWLQGVQNGIMDTPQVTIETAPHVYEQDASWPVPGTQRTQVFLQPGANAGTLGLAPAPGDPGTTTFTDSRTQTEATAMANPTTVTANRRVFLSPVLKAPVRVSGTPVVQLDASANKTETHFGALLVDYGPAFPRVNTRTADGVRTDTTSDCWGESSDVDSACFKDVDEIVDTTTTNWMVSRGVLDAQHRWTEDVQTPIVAGQTYPFSWQLLPQDYTFPAGHQIGIVIEGSDRDWTTADTNAAAITLSLKSSRVSLPVVGGGEALRQAGLAAGEGTSVSVAQDSAQTNDAAPVKLTATVSADDPVMDPEALPDYQQRYLPQGEWAGFTQLGTPTGSVQFLDGGQPLGAPVPLTGGVATSTVTLAGGAHQISAAYLGDGGFDASASPAITHTVGLTSTVGGTVPATLALTLGGPAGFGAFTPGVTADYTASTTATVISTAGDAQLSVADPDTAHPGRLVNGAFALASPVQARAAGAPFADVGASPLALLGWDGPIANAVVPLDFHQHVAATDPLRTGTYAKTLTFTLSTTTP